MNWDIRDLEPFERDWLAEEAESFRALRTARSACPSMHLLRAGLADALPGDLQAALTAHISGCASCRTLQEDLRELPPPAEASDDEAQRILLRVREASSAEPRGRAGVTAWRLAWRPALAAAALLVVAAAGGWYFLTPWDPARVSPEGAPITAQAGGPRAIADRPLPLPQPPRGPALDKPPVRMSLAVLTWRGEGADAQRLMDDIAPVLDAYRADRFAEAAALLEKLRPDHPDAVEIPFYLGVSRLLMGDAAAATTALESAVPLADRAFEADVVWYLGISLTRAGREAEARARFSGLCRGISEYRARACAAVRELDTPPPSS